MFDSISDNPSQVFEIAVFMVYFSLLRNISKYTFGNVSLKYKSEFELIWVPQLTFCMFSWELGGILGAIAGFGG